VKHCPLNIVSKSILSDGGECPEAFLREFARVRGRRTYVIEESKINQSFAYPGDNGRGEENEGTGD